MSNPSPDRAVAILAIAAFASATSTRAADALLPLLALEFGTTPGSAAAVITGFALSYGLLQVVHGPLGDKFGKYRLICLTAGISLLGTLACAFAPTLEFLVFARFAAGTPPSSCRTSGHYSASSASSSPRSRSRSGIRAACAGAMRCSSRKMPGCDQHISAVSFLGVFVVN